MAAAFEQLSEDDREVLELRVVGDLSSDEVAEVIGKKPGTVRMAQARALDRLRTLLGERARCRLIAHPTSCSWPSSRTL